MGLARILEHGFVVDVVDPVLGVEPPDCDSLGRRKQVDVAIVAVDVFPVSSGSDPGSVGEEVDDGVLQESRRRGRGVGAGDVDDGGCSPPFVNSASVGESADVEEESFNFFPGSLVFDDVGLADVDNFWFSAEVEAQ